MDRKIGQSVLDGGVPLVFERVDHVRSVSLGLWIQAGSSHETRSENGLTHFVEHMLFKRTARRSARQIAETLDAVGGQIDAFTGKENTCLYCSVLDENFDLALDLLADLILNSKYREVDVRREKDVVMEEILTYEDTPDEIIHDVLAKAIWPRHSLGRPILGSPEAVTGIERPALMRYVNERFLASPMLISIAGNIDPDKVTEQVNRHLGTLVQSHFKRRRSIPVFNSNLHVVERSQAQVHLCLGFEGIAWNDPRRFAMHVLNELAGGSISSRLFQEVRERAGLCYNIFTYHNAFAGTGLFGLYAGCSPDRFERMLDLTCRELIRIKHKTARKTVNQARQRLKGSFLLGLESTSNRMSRLAKNWLYKRKLGNVDDVVRSIEQVTHDQVMELADSVLDPSRVAGAILGEPGQHIDIESIRGMLS